MALLLTEVIDNEWSVGIVVRHGQPRLAHVGLNAVRFDPQWPRAVTVPPSAVVEQPNAESEAATLRDLCDDTAAPLPAHFVEMLPETPAHVWCDFERAGAQVAPASMSPGCL